MSSLDCLVYCKWVSGMSNFSLTSFLIVQISSMAKNFQIECLFKAVISMSNRDVETS